MHTDYNAGKQGEKQMRSINWVVPFTVGILFLWGMGMFVMAEAILKVPGA